MFPTFLTIGQNAAVCVCAGTVMFQTKWNKLFSYSTWHHNTSWFGGWFPVFQRMAMHSSWRVRSPKCPLWTAHPWRRSHRNPSKCQEPLVWWYGINLTFVGPCIINVFLSTTNKLQRTTIFFIGVSDLHVWSGFSARHQELKNCACSNVDESEPVLTHPR
jgi:hypothetical protein